MNNLDKTLDSYSVNQLSIKYCLKALWYSKKSALFIIFSSALAGIFIAVNTPNIYTANALLSPVKSESPSSFGAYAGLASIAGIGLPSPSNGSSEDAIKTLQSYNFFSNNVLPNISLPDIMAEKKWNKLKNQLSYEESLYDASNNTWVRLVKPPRSSKPSSQEAFKRFKEIYDVTISKDGFLSLSVDHISPHVAKNILDIVIRSINKKFRDEQKRKSESAIEYIRNQINLTDLSEVKTSLAVLLQQETEKLMLIESTEDYVFTIIEKPIASEFKSRPNKVLIVIVSMFIGMFIAFFISLYVFLKNDEQHD